MAFHDEKEKKRCFTFDVYTQEEVERVNSELDNDFMKYCYIFHEKCLNDDGITPKVSHWHYMIDYGAPTTLKYIKKAYGHLASNGYIEPVIRPYNLWRYFWHDQTLERSKGKKEYRPEDVILRNGFDPEDIKVLSSNERMLFMDSIMAVANDEKITEYSGLLEYLSVNERVLYKFAMDNTILINSYMSSHRHRNKKVDSNTNRD